MCGGALKSIASIALPVAAAFTGDPLLMAAAAAGGSALRGGSIGQDLLAGGMGGLGGGLFGSMSGTMQGLDPFGAAISGALNPIGSSITGGISSALSPLSNLFSSAPTGAVSDAAGAASGAASSGAAGAAGSGAGADLSALGGGTSPLSSIASNPLGVDSSGINSMVQGANNLPNTLSTLAPAQQAAAGIGANGVTGATATSSPLTMLGTIAKLAPLVTAMMGGTKYPGTQSQSDIATQKAAQQDAQQQLNGGFETALNAGATKGAPRTQSNPQIDYYSYGSRPEQSFFSNAAPISFPNVQTTPLNSLAKGGMPQGGGGQADDIPAQLSAGEFVVPADVVSSLGDGNSDQGGKQLHHMIKQVRQHKSSRGTSLPPAAKSPLQYLKGGGLLPSPSPVRLAGKAKS